MEQRMTPAQPVYQEPAYQEPAYQQPPPAPAPAPAPAPVAAEPKAPAYMAELEQLASLRTAGVLTDEEFEAKKRLILGL